VLVFEGFHHVAVIGGVIKKTPEWAECIICESRSKDHGGAQSNTWRIEAMKNTGGMIPGRFVVKSLSGAVRDTLD